MIYIDTYFEKTLFYRIKFKVICIKIIEISIFNQYLYNKCIIIKLLKDSQFIFIYIINIYIAFFKKDV